MEKSELSAMVFEALKNSKGYRSILKGIEFSEENLVEVRQAVRKFFKHQKIILRTRFRGARSHHPDHTIKAEANKFDVYVYQVV
tara:strand:- start:9336 stop:9587 length:252 start_codon:yes stop_codon:yes gene_type:complete